MYDSIYSGIYGLWTTGMWIVDYIYDVYTNATHIHFNFLEFYSNWEDVITTPDRPS